MADLVSDGKIRCIWAPSCANIAAPTVAEANAGLRLDTVMTPDGLKITPKTADVDTSSLSSTVDTSRAGRRGFDISLKIKRQDAADTASSTLVFRANGFLFVRRTVDAGTAPTIAQPWEVYPGECKEPARGFGPNTVQTIEVDLGLTGDCNTSAVMA